MKKLLMAVLLLLTICVSLTAVSAEFNIGLSSSESSNFDGDPITFENGKLVIQGIEFAIPDGYKEVEKSKIVEGESKTYKGFNISSDTLAKGKDQIIVRVSYSNTTEAEYAPFNTTVEKTINNYTGWFIEDNFGAVFTYIKDRKLVQVVAPNEDTLYYVIK